MSFSLPTQRCFLREALASVPKTLFSAYAEVFPIGEPFSCTLETFLCLRRGVSAYDANQGAPRGFSLPTQRCFYWESQKRYWGSLFSAYAEVFLMQQTQLHQQETFLCLRRGVSVWSETRAEANTFSLPTQRCFSAGLYLVERKKLFSAYAEVFLYVSIHMFEQEPFLCLRRGVSAYRMRCQSGYFFSLPTQRCF